MRIRMKRDYRGLVKGSVIEPISVGMAEVLLHRGLAEEVQPPPQLVEIPITPAANRGNRKRR